MINSVVLTGRLTAAPELKTTSNGISVTSFSIAVERPYKSGDEKQTDFITIVAWRSTAEFISKYFAKGSAIGIEGSIQTRKYQDQKGNNRVAFEVVADKAHFIERKREQGDNSAPAPQDTGADDFSEIDEDLPF